MSSTSSTATSTGLGQSLCSCSNADCSVNLFTFPDGHEISTELRPCCGLYCKINADSRHWCAICGTNVCGLCGIANLSGADFEPLLRNVICNKHEEFCESHNLPYRQLEIPRAISADDSHADGSDEVNVGDTILDKVTPQLLQQLKSQSWAQVRTTAGFTNLLKKQGKKAVFPTNKDQLTRFRGIFIPGSGIVPTSLISVDNLRELALKCLKMNGMGSKNKRTICEAIADRMIEYLEKKAAGREHEFMNDAANPNIRFYLNIKRFINVLMGGVMKPLITQELFSRLKKDDLDDGLKTCQVFCEKFIAQYNDSSKYGNDLYSVAGFDQDASMFTPIPHGSWDLVAKRIKDESADYEKVYNQSKESGYHGDFNDLPMVLTNPRLAYLHNLCEESSSSEIFRGALFAELPDDVFNESTDRPSGRGGGGGKASGCGRGGKGAKGGENAALNSIASKNEAQKFKLHIETKGILRNQLDDTDKKVNDLTKKFVEHCGGGSTGKVEAKMRLKASKLKRDQTRDNSDDSSDSSDEDPDESQQSLCNRIHNLKDRKKELKGDLKQLNDATPKRRKK